MGEINPPRTEDLAIGMGARYKGRPKRDFE